ncbi:hypothetical protein DE146DRAFT_681129 [Phaeosphaeria sp. MPI-PUGE-AT-0046c]|nr:hypothetical protein DE146DRAFT_681129 [Phaeosphaeria sp. MPI-PUGE-AT-0046c]
MSTPSATIAKYAPEILPFDLSGYAKLDAKQAAHLRHFYNLVSQTNGHWPTMTYATGAAHFHRLPALRGQFRQLMRQMIAKMLRKEVWSYWFLASHSGKVFDPDIKELRKPWADPVAKENIMYSGHLLLMTSLYAMLFDDDEFEREGALTFRRDPLFWGMGPEEFVGVCCEPNAVFVVCNQFPLIAMRYNDVRHGTNHVESEILPKYKEALAKKGLLGDDGLYASFFAIEQEKSIPARHGAHTAWANAFMHAWNPEFVENSYDQQTLGFLTNSDGKTRLHPARVAMAFRRLVSQEGHDPQDLETLDEARKVSQQMLNPTWENGGLYYPRNGRLCDENWNLTHIEPHSGHSGIGYARLNVPNGQKMMWEKPWTRDILKNRPWLDGDSFEDDIDFFRGVWDAEKRAIVLTVRRWRGDGKVAIFAIKNATGETRWAIYVNGKLKEVRKMSQDGALEIRDLLGQEEVDIVAQQLE